VVNTKLTKSSCFIFSFYSTGLTFKPAGGMETRLSMHVFASSFRRIYVSNITSSPCVFTIGTKRDSPAIFMKTP